MYRGGSRRYNESALRGATHARSHQARSRCRAELHPVATSMNRQPERRFARKQTTACRRHATPLLGAPGRESCELLTRNAEAISAQSSRASQVRLCSQAYTRRAWFACMSILWRGALTPSLAPTNETVDWALTTIRAITPWETLSEPSTLYVSGR